MIDCKLESFKDWEHLFRLPVFWTVIAGILLSFITFTLVRRLLNPFLVHIFSRNQPAWRPVLQKNKPFFQLAFLVPVLFWYFFLQHISGPDSRLWHYFNTYIFINVTLLFGSCLRTAGDLYELYPISRVRPIKSYVQLAVLIIYILGGIGAICELLAVRPTAFITGAVAVMAAILLVFRDTILSFIASMQIAANNLIRKGDWIEVKQYGADGDVIDIALHVIRVQNFDKTIVSIPTYKVLEAGFRNWRGMFESGGRQIKRSLFIDQTSIKFLTARDLEHLRQNSVVGPYIRSMEELKDYGEGGSSPTLTNLGVFRAYLQDYLTRHSKIREDMTLLVRHLDPTPEGIPLQLYAYCNDTNWEKYENIQSEIFEHIMALLPIFGLKVFQNPMDLDISRLHKVLEDFNGGAPAQEVSKTI